MSGTIRVTESSLRARLGSLLAVSTLALLMAASPAGAGGRRCDGLAQTISGSGTVTGTTAGDVIVGSSRPDQIDSLGGNDTICSLGGDDTVDAGVGTDVIDAGRGDDSLLGGLGADTLTGGPGRDRFLLTDRNAADTISDLVSGNDRVAVDVSAIPVGNMDTTIDNPHTTAGGAWPQMSELVISARTVSALTLVAVGSEFPPATAPVPTGESRLLIVSDGTSSAVLFFTSLDGNADVAPSELDLLATATGAATLVSTDVSFVP